VKKNGRHKESRCKKKATPKKAAKHLQRKRNNFSKSA
jgi:hypothetical protein